MKTVTIEKAGRLFTVFAIPKVVIKEGLFQINFLAEQDQFLAVWLLKLAKAVNKAAAGLDESKTAA